MRIPLQEALDLIESADVVKLVDGDDYITPDVYTDGVTGMNVEVLSVVWETDDGQFSIEAFEDDNREVERKGHKLIFISDDGSPFELHLFRTVPILA